MPTATTDRRAARRERMREQIVEAAWKLARRDGIAQLSLRDLAAEVGMRAPSLYGYFDGKDAIYDAMFAEGYRQLDAALDTVIAAVPDDADDAAQLTAATEAFLRFCSEDLARYQLLFTRVIPGWEPSPDAYGASVASFASMAAWLADHGIEGAEALDLWTAVTAGLAAQQTANDPGGDRYVRLAGSAVRMFLRHLEQDPTEHKAG